MSFTSLPPIDQALEPASVRSGTPAQQRTYESARSFEDVLVQQLAQELSQSVTPQTDGAAGDATSTDGSTDSSLLGQSDPAASAYAQLLPDALTQGVMGAGGLGIASELAPALAQGESS